MKRTINYIYFGWNVEMGGKESKPISLSYEEAYKKGNITDIYDLKIKLLHFLFLTFNDKFLISILNNIYRPQYKVCKRK